MVEHTLSQLGLSEKEIKVYLALLGFGQSTVNRIAESTGYAKSTCYDLLRSLISRGLASSVIKDKKKHFEAADPHALISNLTEQKQRAEAILPELVSIYKSGGNKPALELYAGKRGVRDIFDKIILTKKDMCAFTNESKFTRLLLPEWFIKQFRTRRKTARVYNRAIAEDSEAAREMKTKDKQELRTTKIDEIMNNQSAECYIFGDKVAFVTLSEKEPIGVLIESKEIADLQRAIFERVWKSQSKA